jgi:hypothetical protein
VRRPKPVFDLVVFDGSALLFGENVTKTKQAVTGMKATHPSIVVAGELGFHRQLFFNSHPDTHRTRPPSPNSSCSAIG